MEDITAKIEDRQTVASCQRSAHRESGIEPPAAVTACKSSVNPKNSRVSPRRCPYQKAVGIYTPPTPLRSSRATQSHGNEYRHIYPPKPSPRVLGKLRSVRETAAPIASECVYYTYILYIARARAQESV